MDELLTRIPDGVKIRAELDGLTIELLEDTEARLLASILRGLLTPGFPFSILLTIMTAIAWTALSFVLIGALLDWGALGAGGEDIVMPLLLAGMVVGIGAGFRLPPWLHRRLSRPRRGRRCTMRLGLHDITLHHGGRPRTVLLSDVLFVDPGPPPKLVLSGAERLALASGLPRASQQWLVELLEVARTRRGADQGEAEIPTALLALQQQTDTA